MTSCLLSDTTQCLLGTLKNSSQCPWNEEGCAAYLCMAIGTAVGCIIPVVGIPVGMTLGGLIGWKIGKDSYEETVKETE